MTRRVMRHRKAPDELWSAWWRRIFREANAVVDALDYSLVFAARQRLHRLAGHSARAADHSILFSASRWRNQAWWREQQGRIEQGAEMFRRPVAGKPVSWELEFEKMRGTTWYDLAIDRQNWRDEETWFASKGLTF